ncbi:hypothetical protein GUJ93_ZPchr0004g40367 [Zizania palustris]|uniref:Uncharacterized protein n=1 Tax=Zizania palustris TaxID=103762 RepID=A0A8J5SZT0_ZIZPA|nr:hypothetical protein GUJ93_ZPchr0004g40367 [Zizania palustris]
MVLCNWEAELARWNCSTAIQAAKLRVASLIGRKTGSSAGCFCLEAVEAWARFPMLPCWNLDSQQLVKTCEVSFDESILSLTHSFELSGDDELREFIFDEDDDTPAVDEGGPSA